MKGVSEASWRLYDATQRAPWTVDQIEQLTWESGANFMVQGMQYAVVDRLYPTTDHPRTQRGCNTFRYLAQNCATGELLCLTTIPEDLYVCTSGPRSTGDIERKLNIFFSEPEVLIRLARAEAATGTHFFPRLRSPIFSLAGGRFAYLTEFVPGTSILDVTAEHARQYRDEFRRGMGIAHLVNVTFHDLTEEDLRILPDGRLMFLDFNVNAPTDGSTRSIAADYRKLDLLLNVAS